MLETPLKAAPTDKVIAEGTRGQSAGNVNDISWLCGFIDGEGCFTLRRRVPWRKQNHLTFQPELAICNTHIPTLDAIASILNTHGLGCYIGGENPTNKKRHPNWKPSRRLVVAGHKRLQKLMPLLLPHLRTKKEQAKIISDFIEFRSHKNTRDVYGVEELQFVEKLKVLNRRGSSETTRVPLTKSDDIVQAETKKSD